MIDVIIPVYNGEKFIIDAIKSIEGQTLKPASILLINDGSTDNTEKIILECKNICSIPLIYIKKENGGPNSARNLGLEKSNTEFVAFIDADDIWSEDKLEKQFQLYKNSKYNNLGLVYSNYHVIDNNGESIKNPKLVPLDKEICGNAFEKLLGGNKILGSASSVLIKKEVFKTVGLFDENLYFGEDWDMWLRIAEKYDVDFVNEKLVYIRMHNQNRTNMMEKVFFGELEFFNKWSKKISDKYSTPNRWPDQIIFHLLFQLPKIKLVNKMIRSIPNDTKKVMFKKTYGSIFLYSIFFINRKIFYYKNWYLLIQKIKRKYDK